ncbi:unnamed protein product [Taenia asiatica]|uniref:ANK_REP_REGION domain-containing protein n=1 Tax=Taenia asiatica TaxID=60517 RepID=A0A0R3WFZ3_TAEAS|nr:unnamed protein product [Taenia asiatica]
MEDTSAVKMAALFYLILLATSVFAGRGGHGPGILANKNLELKDGLPKHFWWIFVGSGSVGLGWDATALADLQRKPDEIKLTAFYYNESISYSYVAVPFTHKKLTLKGLIPNTTYLTLLEAFEKGNEIFAHLTAIKTATKVGISCVTALEPKISTPQLRDEVVAIPSDSPYFPSSLASFYFHGSRPYLKFLPLVRRWCIPVTCTRFATATVAVAVAATVRNAGYGTLFNIVIITGSSGCQQSPSLLMVAMAKGNVDMAANALEATETAPDALGIVVAAAVGCRAVAIVRPIDALFIHPGHGEETRLRVWDDLCKTGCSVWMLRESEERANRQISRHFPAKQYAGQVE